MATSIFFTESKDFKLIKDRILNHEDNYLVYVYADTTNIRIPKELIMQLPKYGNNLIWVDTAEMDSSDISHHIVLTIGQLVNPEEEIDFFIVSKSSKLDKTIIFLRNQGIPAEMIAPAEDKPKVEKAKGTGHRGRPKKEQIVEEPVVKTGKRGRPKKEKPAVEAVEVVEDVEVVEALDVLEVVETPVQTSKRGRRKKVQAEIIPVAEVIEVPKKKRGRPSLTKVAETVAEAVVEEPAEEKAVEEAVAETETEVIVAEPKKRGRKKIVKPVVEEKPKRGRKAAIKIDEAETTPAVKKEKKVKEVKEVKQRKQRVDKEITDEMVQEKLNLYATTDTNVSTVMTWLFSQKKVARSKFEAKLIDMIKFITLEDDTVAERILVQLQEMQVLELGADGRVFYKD